MDFAVARMEHACGLDRHLLFGLLGLAVTRMTVSSMWPNTSLVIPH
jgi:hypothetical protein